MEALRVEVDSPGDAAPRPHTNTYWLWPGRLLAGEHPGFGGAEALPFRLLGLQATGVTRCIDLTASHEPVPRYEPLPVAGRAACSQRFPIADFGLPDVAGMREVLRTIDGALADGEIVYLHCRAGVGRTGTVAGCWLVEQGLAPPDALALLARKWKAMARCAREPRTPQTPAQRDFVAGWQPLRPAASAPP